MLRFTRKWSALRPPDALAKRAIGQYGRPLRCYASARARHQSTNESSRNSGCMAAIAGFSALVFLNGSSSTTTCEKKTESPLLRELFPADCQNPLWPGGCREEDVDAFVNQVLKDPSINIPGLPDAVERIVYKSTVRLVLNIFYWLLSQMHGFSLLEHQVVLQVERKNAPLVLGDWDRSGDKVDEEVLEMVTDRLLANQAVNYTLVPDAIERPLYINSLRLVFRLLDILTASFSLNVCGHVLLMDLVPLRKDQEDLQKHSLSSSLTRIDLEKVRAVARRHAGILEQDKSELSFLQRFSIRDEFLAQLHASIYALVLGIADDVLANAEIQLLSDKITLDLVPGKVKEDKLQSDDPVLENAKDEYIQSNENQQASSGFNAQSFLMGCGVGLTAAAAVLAAGKSGR